MKNFGEFYNNQIEHASAIILSRTQNLSEEKLAAAVALLREKNAQAPIVTTPWDELSGAQLLDAMERRGTLMAQLAEEVADEHGPTDTTTKRAAPARPAGTGTKKSMPTGTGMNMSTTSTAMPAAAGTTTATRATTMQTRYFKALAAKRRACTPRPS